MLEILDSHKLLLASKSPRRKELLRSAGIPFKLINSDYEEIYDPKMNVENVPGFLAYNKAINAKDEIAEDEIVLAADTVVIYKGELLGKPKDKTVAKSTLKKLSGKKHTVITGITLMNKIKTVNASAYSTVWIDNLSKKEISYYIDIFNPMDKAGSYGIQDWMGICKVYKIKGSYPNIMGMPTHLVYSILSNW